MTRSFRRGVGVGAGLVVLMAVAIAVAFVPGLGAQEDGGEDSSDNGTSEDAPRPRGLSDDDRACLEEHGVDLPLVERDENGHPTERPDLSDQEKQALRDAAEACGIERPFFHRGAGRPLGSLTDEERACLEEHGVDLPDLQTDENGNPVRPSERQQLSAEERQQRRQAFRDAADACGLDLPERCDGPAGSEHSPQSSEENSNEPAVLAA